jgi:Xaa-Pro aminopeptidase
MDYKGRLRRLQGELESAKLDALLVTHLPNIYYLCGFSGSAGVLLVTASKSVFITDGRYDEQAHTEVQGSRILISRKSPFLTAAKSAKSIYSRKGRVRLGFEAEHFVVAQRTRLYECLGPQFQLKEAQPLVEKLRIVKDDEEIQRLREAAMVGCGLFDTALKKIGAGVKEVEVAAEMEHSARRAGAQQMSFSTIIASGPRSALPHGRATEARIPASGFVVCDFGVILTGYCSDMTRTVFVGGATSEERQAYEAVRESQAAAVRAVRPGVSVAQVDRAARMSLKKSGLDQFFTHSTGHGVGIEIHEAPRVARGATDVLRPGMVITIEPGVYVPGKFGVRIEDMVVVTEKGCEILTPTGRELTSI